MGEPGANPDHKHDFCNEDIVEMMSDKSWVLVRDEVRSGGDEYSFLQVYRKTNDGRRVRQEEPVDTRKKVAILRPGVYGDVVIATTIIPGLMKENYHITMYVEEQGEKILRNDDRIDRLIVFNRVMLPPTMWGDWVEHEKPKYDRFIDLVEAFEGTLLPSKKKRIFWMPKSYRDKICNFNYAEAVHLAAGVPWDGIGQRFRTSP